MTNDHRFFGRVAFVTGAASGIGAATASRLLAEGAKVATFDLVPSGLDGAVALTGDVSVSADVDAAVAATTEKLGPIDVLVCSAGVSGNSLRTQDVSDAEWRRVMAINTDGVFWCNRAVAPGMAERGYGRIVNVASIAGKEGNPMAAAYSGIAPAVIETAMLGDMSQEHIDYMVEKIPMGRMGEADEVAALICWLASEECSFSTGATYDISGGRAVF